MVTLVVLVTDELHLRECHFDLYRGAHLLRSFQFRYLTHDSVLSAMMPSLDMVMFHIILQENPLYVCTNKLMLWRY